MRPTLVTVLTVEIIIMGFGWAIGSLYALQYALIHQKFPTVGPITLLGGGAFDRLGIGAQIVAGLIFVSVSALRMLSAYWIWHLSLEGAILELILMGLSAIFWYGFALPLGPISGIFEMIVIILIWKTLV